MGRIIGFHPSQPETLLLKFSISDGHPGRVENVEWTWEDLTARLRKSTRDSMTLQEFRALSEDQQLRRKNNGYFVGAQFRDGRRKKVNMSERTLLTFDIDDCTPGLLADLDLGTSGIGDIEYVVYSTRKHSFPNNIRVRLVLPLPYPLKHDKFQAVSRLLAAKLDPSMKTVDKVSFSDAQFMYWPSHCADVKPLFIHNIGTGGAMVDPDAMLADCGFDWRDFALLPHTSREAERRRPAEKMQNPLEKRGIVGAFCRTFNVPDAIEEFLSDIYRPSEPGRYTYTPGTTANGCVVYDEGNAFFSHHGTDPASDRACNSYDLVRIHKFGHLDKDTDTGTPAVQLPSYKGMQEFLLDQREVQKDYLEHEISDEDVDEIFDAEGGSDLEDDSLEATSREYTAEELKDDPNLWKLDLDLTAEGKIKSTLYNIVLILRHAKIFAGKFAFDEFHNLDVVRRPIKSNKLKINTVGPSLSDPVGRLTEAHLTAARLIMEAPRKSGGWGFPVSERDLIAAHDIISKESPFHPVRDYLNGLTWDKTERMELLWLKACHTADTLYYREAARLWMTAAVARVYEPACKFDFCPIIEGPQGLYKSTMLAVLGNGWTTELTPNFDNPARLVEATQGYWIVEIPELAQFGKAEIAQIKALITETAAKGVRLAYAKLAGYYPRQFVFAGTTNDEQYLKDQTGNRRFWPIRCGKGQIDIEWVGKNRDQLWAEAVASYRAMRQAKPTGALPLYLKGPAASEATSAQEERMIDDGTRSAAGVIEYWLNVKVTPAQAVCGAEPGDHFDDADGEVLVHRTRTCGKEIHERAMNGRRDNFDATRARFIARAMKRVPGWITGKMARCGIYGRQFTYVRIWEVASEDDDL